MTEYFAELTQLVSCLFDGSDMSMIDNDAFNFVTGYLNTDVKGDNIIDVTNLALIDNNAFNFTGCKDRKKYFNIF